MFVYRNSFSYLNAPVYFLVPRKRRAYVLILRLLLVPFSKISFGKELILQYFKKNSTQKLVTLHRIHSLVQIYRIII